MIIWESHRISPFPRSLRETWVDDDNNNGKKKKHEDLENTSSFQTDLGKYMRKEKPYYDSRKSYNRYYSEVTEVVSVTTFHTLLHGYKSGGWHNTSRKREKMKPANLSRKPSS